MIASLDLDERSIELIVTQTVSPITNLEPHARTRHWKLNQSLLPFLGLFFRQSECVWKWHIFTKWSFHKKLWWTRGYGGTLFSDKPICIQWLTRKSWSFRAATKINSTGYITLHSLKSLTILDELPLTIPILPGLGRDVKEAGRPSWQLHR